MTTIFSLDEWTEITDRGTSGDQVADILASWKEDRRWLLGEVEAQQEELERLRAALRKIEIRGNSSPHESSTALANIAHSALEGKDG